MNNFEQEPATIESDTKIELTTDSLHSLDSIWRWASFFSILGFLLIAFLILVGIVMGFVFSIFDDGQTSAALKYGIMAFYFLFGGICFYPILLLFRFSSWTKKALRNKSSLDFSVALKNLKNHFKYIGIMTIVMYTTYFVIIIGIMAYYAVSIT
jgi:hypothetical protein